ncbi:Carboxypeptidase regulatory-like domain-containing protein [Granulicella pectinivorans]|uniref:Carboxypeptidase regulatory-like domain-containing protein n=1 Tax=Granulicella pectinivorans TaxID=474950 RepID=A0A1I6L3W5_9BACT|nr:carboxypeptidase regulatory-like domain-containing protein [Granulicella pectinivorans]SFR98161.1 Carboxypeptidase regulatory-like domain-containing protein [Granulicella pectinivorans]
MNFRRWALPGLASLLFVCTVPLLAQGTQATLDGQVTDSAGAVLPSAKITIRNVQTGVSTISVSGPDGYYHVSSLDPGQYSITVQQPSFATSIRNGVQFEVAQHATLDFTLTVGSVNEHVTVTAAAVQLETETATQSMELGQEKLLALPTQGHNPISAVFSVPGVIVTSSDTRLRAFDTAGTSGTSINGSPNATNEILVDGMSSLQNASTASFIPTQEATSEVRVQTTNYDAAYGWTLGGVINMLTKSGTNQFHGSAWEYLQNTLLNANSFNNKYTGTPRASSHLNTFGFSISGPIITNKLFAMYTYEDLRQVIPDPFVVSVPTDLQKVGDFSQTYNADGSLQVIYDPYSTFTNASGVLQRKPVPGNNLKNLTYGMSPIALKVLAMLPSGNVKNVPITGLNNLTNGPSNRKFTDFFPENTIRVDYAINPATRVFGRYSRNALQEARGFRYSTNSTLNAADTTSNNPFTRENHNGTVQVTRILNPTTVLSARVGLERYKTASIPSQDTSTGPAALGFASDYATQSADVFPQFTWANYNGAGAVPAATTTSYNYTVGSSVAKSAGTNNLTAGIDLRLLRNNVQSPGNSSGKFAFDQQFTGANPLAVSSTSGNALASFLLGTPQTGSIDKNSFPTRQMKMISLFLQDDVRLRKNLTVNLGIRWDYLGTITDRFNGLATFNPSIVNPLAVTGQTLYGGLQFAGVNGQQRGITNQRFGNLGPRVGVSYQIDRSTVLHGGYGLLYGQALNDPGEAPGFSYTTNMVTSVQSGVPYNTLSDPFPNSSVQSPSYAANGLKTYLGQSFSFADPNGKAPTVQQFSFGIQHQFPKDFLLTLSYVGSRFGRLPVSHQINAVPLSAVGYGATYLTQSVANPFAGLLPGTALNNATVQRQQLLAPYPQFLVGTITGTSGINEMFMPIGSSSYNSGQFVLQKRLSYGLDFTVQYTMSKQLDQKLYSNPQDTSLQKVIAAWDIPRNMQISLLWQLPFGRGRAFGSHLAAPVRWAISGWDVSSLVRLQAGMPLDLTNSTNSVPTGNPALAHPTLARWFNNCTQLASGATQYCQAGDTPVWTVRQAYQLQTWKTRLSSVRLPGVHNADISVSRNIPITDRVHTIFRTDFINAFNSAQFFNGPTSDVNSANFGKILGVSDQSNLPRFVQFSLKAEF